MSELDKIGLVNRGDVIRAIRQVITDAKVDVDAIIRDEVAKVVAKRVANADLQAPLLAHAQELVKRDLYNLRDMVARRVANSITLKAPQE